MSTTTRVVRRFQAGFTLIELMVVMVIVGILASVGANIYTGHMRQANVSRAIPYLQNIAAKQRIHYNRTGKYLATLSENDIQSRLGVNLAEMGDFCFMAFCADGDSRCGSYDGSGVLGASTLGATLAGVPSGVAPAFQVIAVLRAGGTPVNGAGKSCVVATNKLAANGWVGSEGTKGGQGRVVVMSYPPENGTVAGNIGGHPATLDWTDGITLSDALVD